MLAARAVFDEERRFSGESGSAGTEPLEASGEFTAATPPRLSRRSKSPPQTSSGPSANAIMLAASVIHRSRSQNTCVADNILEDAYVNDISKIDCLVRRIQSHAKRPRNRLSYSVLCFLSRHDGTDSQVLRLDSRPVSNAASHCCITFVDLVHQHGMARVRLRYFRVRLRYFRVRLRYFPVTRTCYQLCKGNQSYCSL
nr:hypothetical protein CFP56_71699 [Quercus suber]